MDRNLLLGEAENDWYYEFLQNGEEYSLNVDNDEVMGADNKITLFVNCKSKNPQGQVIGVVGVGVNIDYLQDLLRQYENKYNVDTFLIDAAGAIQVSGTYNGYSQVDWVKINESENIRQEVLEWKNGKTNWDCWMPSSVQCSEKSYLVVRYILDLEWYLLVKQDTGALVEELNAKVLQTTILSRLTIVMGTNLVISAFKEFVRFLRSNFRESDIVGRVGGDEFVVFVPSQSMESVWQKPEQLCRVLAGYGVPEKRQRFEDVGEHRYRCGTERWQVL